MLLGQVPILICGMNHAHNDVKEMALIMKKLKNMLVGLLAILIMLSIIGGGIAIVYGLVSLVGIIWRGLVDIVYTVSTMDAVVIIAVISGAVTVLGLIINSIISVRLKYSEYRHRRKVDLVNKMEQPYREFVGLMFEMVRIKEDTGSLDEAMLTQHIRDMSKVITLYGSNELIKKWADYRMEAANLSVERHLLYLEEILYTIRKDMGIEKGKMRQGDLLMLFMKDIDDLTVKRKKGRDFHLSWDVDKARWKSGWKEDEEK
jgi:hypothetical protein